MDGRTPLSRPGVPPTGRRGGTESLSATVGLAAPADESIPGRRNTLWVVQDGGDPDRCLALVLAGYGDAWAAIELARGMGPRHTLFAFQPPDDDAEFREVASLRGLADLYVERLLARRPRGPYALAGYSAGALIALEMARQLHARGATVAAVYLLDPLLARYTRLERVCYRLMELTIALLRPVARRTRPWKIMAAMVQDRGLQRHLHALRGEIPQPYAGSVTLVEAWGSRFVRPPTFMRDLRRMARGGVERWRQTATHHSFMRPPHVHRLGEELARRMAPAATAR